MCAGASTTPSERFYCRYNAEVSGFLCFCALTSTSTVPVNGTQCIGRHCQPAVVTLNTAHWSQSMTTVLYFSSLCIALFVYTKLLLSTIGVPSTTTSGKQLLELES